MDIEIVMQPEEDILPDLDEVVLDALDLFIQTPLPELPLDYFDGYLLVLGSGNAAVIGKIIFEYLDARVADESTYESELEIITENKEDLEDHVSVVVISASGGKHAVGMAEALQQSEISTWLFTNNERAPARRFIDAQQLLVFPKNPEPYTYNVSTYMGMLLSYTQEDPGAIKEFLLEFVVERISDAWAQFDAFYFILPPEFISLKDLFATKFDELFGSLVSVRIFTLEQSKHAKTVVPSDREAFISFGVSNHLFGDERNRFYIPLPEHVDYATVMAIGYYVIGHIQKQHPPYFKENIERYTEEASEFFGETISPVVT